MTKRERILEILNRDLSPWTFDGTEPMARDLIAVADGSDASNMTITTNANLVAGDVFTIAGEWRSRPWWKRAWYRVRYFKMLPFVLEEFRVREVVESDSAITYQRIRPSILP